MFTNSMDTLRYCTNTVHSHTFGVFFVRLSHGNISILSIIQTNCFHARNIRIEWVLCVCVCFYVTTSVVQQTHLICFVNFHGLNSMSPGCPSVFTLSLKCKICDTSGCWHAFFKHFKLTEAQIVSFGVVTWLRAEQQRNFLSIPSWDKEMSLSSP